MSEEDPESKTEEPTETRISDALKKGQVAVSREVLVLASIIGLTVWILFVAPGIAGTLLIQLTALVEHAANRDISTGSDVMLLLLEVAIVSLKALAALFVILICTALVAAFLQTEPRFVATRVAPKLSHLSLAKGWKRIFGKQGFAEFAKSLFKLTVAITIAVVVLGSADSSIISLMWRPPSLLADFVMSQIGTLLMAILGAMAAVAIADYMWTKKRWRDGLKMTRKDVTDELRQAEGDPVVKSRLRSLAQDRSRHRMLDNVSTATLVLANPTHLAIALRYRHGEDKAPVVVAKGAELLSARIRESAEEHGIPIFQKKPLARALYPIAVVDQPIPEAFYAAIADLINIIQESAQR